VSDAELGGALALERVDLGAEDELVAPGDAIEGGADLSEERAVLGAEVEERNLHFAPPTGVHFAPSMV